MIVFYTWGSSGPFPYNYCSSQLDFRTSNIGFPMECAIKGYHNGQPMYATCAPHLYLCSKNPNFAPCSDHSSLHCPHWICEPIGSNNLQFWTNHDDYIYINRTTTCTFWTEDLHVHIKNPKTFPLLPHGQTCGFQLYVTSAPKSIFITLHKKLLPNIWVLTSQLLTPSPLLRDTHLTAPPTPQLFNNTFQLLHALNISDPHC